MKKKLMFKNTTQYSKKLYDEFNRFHSEKFSLSYDLFTLFILVLLIFCIFETIKAKIISLVILFIVILLVFLGYRIFHPVIFYKKQVKRKAISKEKVFNFYFYDNYFKIRDKLNSDKIYYLNLHKIYETKNYYYLYMTKKYSFILDKSGFSQGTSEEFSKFLKTKLWFKYSKYEKKNSAKK